MDMHHHSPRKKLMPMKATLVLLVFTVSIAPSLAAQQTTGEPAGSGRVVTQTRLVSRYAELEDQLATAAIKRDQVKLKQILEDDFNQWTPVPPGDPLPLEDWLAQYHPTSFRVRQLAVQSFQDVDIVSLVLSQQGHLGKSSMDGDYFVVDIWRHEDAGPRLAVRYISRSQKATFKSPTPTGKQ